MRIVIKKSRFLKTTFRPLGLACLGLLVCLLVAGATVFTLYYVRFSRLIDARLQGQVFPHMSQIYAAPEKLLLGRRGSAARVASQLRQAGYTDRKNNPTGWYQMLPDGIRVMPGPESYFAQEGAEIRFANGEVRSIVSLNDQFARSEYSLEPLLLTNLFDQSREKRRLVAFEDLPQHLIDAVLAIEDRRFFQHSGVDYLRILKAAYVDLRAGRAEQGASTITMQLARSFFFNTQRTIKRKLAETLVAFLLERRLTKQQIFEYYCNKIYLGQRGSFTISGFGEAAQAYFNKDVRQLSLAEAAFLAGIIRGPNLYSPHRRREAAIQRRNRVLAAMTDIGAITPEGRDQAMAEGLDVAPSYAVASEAPYFVDLVKDQLLEKYPEEELASESYRIYTGLDLRLQRAAAEAVRAGMAEVDERLAAMWKSIRARRGAKGKDADAEDTGPRAEVALVALDPHTGAVKALIGGKDYGYSQLNRALARRQPGSVFKPFVYAAALSPSTNGWVGPPWTPISKVYDEPTTFVFDGGTYEPANYNDHYFGPVTLRYALARSLNVSTVKVAQMVGYERVVDLARRAGMNLRIQPTPAVALGAYEVTPLEIAGAYTIFANHGVRMDPYLVEMIRARNGVLLERKAPGGRPVLDPGVAFLMTNLLENAINQGTGVGARARGFSAPAAGKTGTSHDGWFAGYTSDLLTIVWVGYDSDLELPLSGAASALPVWTEFMKRAVTLPEYSRPVAAAPPPGVVQEQIDPDTGGLATPYCPRVQTEYFLAGTQPPDYCPLHGMPALPRGGATVPSIASLPPEAVAEPAPAPVRPQPVAVTATPPAPPPQPAAAEPKPKKKGFFGRLFGIFTGGSDDSRDAPKQVR